MPASANALRQQKPWEDNTVPVSTGRQCPRGFVAQRAPCPGLPAAEDFTSYLHVPGLQSADTASGGGFVTDCRRSGMFGDSPITGWLSSDRRDTIYTMW